MAAHFRLFLFAAVCLFTTSALLAQDYAGSCNDCANCLVRDPSGNWISGNTCADWSGYVPNCSSWGCMSGCTGTAHAVCEPDGDGIYHYLLLHRVENPSDSPIKLVRALITTPKGTRSILVKRVS
jgi:hypothetical protein